MFRRALRHCGPVSLCFLPCALDKRGLESMLFHADDSATCLKFYFVHSITIYSLSLDVYLSLPLILYLAMF